MIKPACFEEDQDLKIPAAVWGGGSVDHEIPTYDRFPFSVASGSGSWITTTEGRRYLDFYAGHAVCSTGHCHPAVVAAVSAQARELLFYSNLVHLPIRTQATEALVELCPAGLDRVFFTNSGTEANEAALFLARKLAGRPTVVAFEGGFHGRTVGSLSSTGITKYRDRARVLLTDQKFAPWGDAAAVAALLANGDVAAVILEPIQSMGGCRTAPASFYQELRSLCDQHGTYLIYDEVQTGMGRTGTPFFAGRHGVTPDFMTLGKGIASGIPMGALVTTAAIAAKVKPGDLGTTFGGGPIACAALAATVSVIHAERLCQNVAVQGDYLKATILRVAKGLVVEVRGEGLLLGLVAPKGAKPIQKALLARGIITGVADDATVLRLIPPLTASRSECDHFLKALAQIAEEGFVDA